MNTHAATMTTAATTAVIRCKSTYHTVMTNYRWYRPCRVPEELKE